MDHSEVNQSLLRDVYTSRLRLVPISISWVMIACALVAYPWQMAGSSWLEILLTTVFLIFWGMLCLVLALITLISLFFATQVP